MCAVVLDTSWTGTSFVPPTPLDIATIEAAILSQLRTDITVIEIVHYPDKPETYRLTHRVGAALIRYEGAKYGKLIDSAAIVQERRLEFAIKLLMRDLGWTMGGAADGPTPGAYAMLEAIRLALSGFEVPGCSQMFPVHEKFVERDKQGGVWIYEMLFALTTAAIQVSPADNFPLFVKGTAQEEGGQTTVSIAPAAYTFDSSGKIQLSAGNLIAVAVSNVVSGASYIAGNDYTVDTVNGLIMTASGGAIPAGATVNVAYSYAEVVTVLAGGGSAPTVPTN